MKDNLIYFNAYRYLLIPQEYIQMNFVDGISDRKELEAKKNYFFKESVYSLKEINLYDEKFQIVNNNNDILLMKIGIKKQTVIGTPELYDQRMDDWRSLYVIFCFPKQMILIQHKTKIGADTKSIANRLHRILYPKMQTRSLNLQINQIARKNLFWEIVRKNPGRVKEVSFTLTAPNFAEITKHLGDELQEAMRSVQAARSKITLGGDGSSVLSLSEDNVGIANLAEYAEQGGGSFSIKLSNMKRKTSKDGAKELSVAALEMEGPASAVLETAKRLCENAEN